MPSCYVCKQFFNVKALKTHLKLIHGKQPLTDSVKCNECKQPFSCMKYLFNHFPRCCRRSVSGVEDFAHAGFSNSLNEPSSNDIIDDHGVLSNEPLDDVEMSDLSEASINPLSQMSEEAALFLAKLYSSVSIPRNFIQIVVDEASSLFDSTAQIMKDKLEILLPGVSDNIEVQNLLEKLGNPFSALGTEYKRLKHFEKQGTYIPPFEFNIAGQRTDQKYVKGEALRVPVPVTGQFISPKRILERLLGESTFLNEVLEYNNKLINSDHSLLSNFIQGRYWREKLLRHPGKTILPIFIFVDEFEVTNPIGPSKTVHKLGGAYMTMPCIPPHLRSKLKYVFVVLLFHSADRKTFGNEAVFRLLIKELNELATEGIEFKINSFSRTIFFHLALLQGDNLGLHQLIDFAEGFTANFPCRICNIHRNNLHSDLEENPGLLRTVESYERDLVTNDLSQTGVRSNSIWNKVYDFHVTTSVAVDSFHDLLEGICHYDMTLILTNFIFEEKYFDMDKFNLRLESFDFGLIDKRSRPPLQSKSDVEKGKLSMSAHQMLIFCKYFGIMFCDCEIPEDDPFWLLYLSLRSILDIVLSKNVQEECEIQLKVYIRDHHKLYLQCSKANLKNKFHHLVHYPRYLKLFASFLDMWVMRLEAKHMTSKLIAYSVTTRRNICLTLAIRLMLLLNWFFISRTSDTHGILTGPGSLISVSALDNYECVKKYVPVEFKELYKCSWANVDSVEYKPKMIVIYEYQDFSPVFAMIEQVLVHNYSSLHFNCRKIRTLYLDNDCAGYCVDVLSDDFIFINQEKLVYEQPLCLSRTYDNRQMITFMGL